MFLYQYGYPKENKPRENRCPNIKFKIGLMEKILLFSLFGKKKCLNTLVSELNFISKIIAYKTNCKWTCSRSQAIILSWKRNLDPTKSSQLSYTVHFMKNTSKKSSEITLNLLQYFKFSEKNIVNCPIHNIFEYIFKVGSSVKQKLVLPELSRYSTLILHMYLIQL